MVLCKESHQQRDYCTQVVLLNHDQTDQARSAHLLEGPNKEKALHYQKELHKVSLFCTCSPENPTCYLFQEFAGSTKAKSRQKVKAPTDPRISWKRNSNCWKWRLWIPLQFEHSSDQSWFSMILVQSIWAFVKCHLHQCLQIEKAAGGSMEVEEWASKCCARRSWCT